MAPNLLLKFWQHGIVNKINLLSPCIILDHYRNDKGMLYVSYANNELLMHILL